MKIGSLFSGAGALDLAALELFPGSMVAWHSEIDLAASKVLAYRFPEVPNLGSVTDVDWASVEPVDVIIGGFPCQDVSAAGRRAGLAVGTRSGLWSHMANAIAVLKPRYALIENVEGLLSASAVRELESGSDDLGDSGSGPVLRAAGAVCGDLASLGYDTSWTCLRASEVGACHRRSRVFILAHPADTNSVAVRQQSEPESWRGGASIAGFAGEGLPVTLLPTPKSSDATRGDCQSERGRRSPSLVAVHDVHTDWGVYGAAVARQESFTRRAPSPIELNRNGNPRLNPAFAEWMMAWPSGWVTDPAIGLTRAEQLKCIGNGVITIQAVPAFRYLFSLESLEVSP